MRCKYEFMFRLLSLLLSNGNQAQIVHYPCEILSLSLLRTTEYSINKLIFVNWQKESGHRNICFFV